MKKGKTVRYKKIQCGLGMCTPVPYPHKIEAMLQSLVSGIRAIDALAGAMIDEQRNVPDEQNEKIQSAESHLQMARNWLDAAKQPPDSFSTEKPRL